MTVSPIQLYIYIYSYIRLWSKRGSVFHPVLSFQLSRACSIYIPARREFRIVFSEPRELAAAAAAAAGRRRRAAINLAVKSLSRPSPV